MLEFLKKYKLSYQLYNLFQKKRLQHNIPLYKKYGLQKKYHTPISSSDFQGIPSPKNKYDEYDSAIEMPNDPSFQKLDPNIQQQLLSWSANGYVILENFLSDIEVDSINKEVDRLFTSGTIKFRYNEKLMFAYRHSKLLKDTANSEKMMSVLSALMGKPVELFQSINFLRGSQQRTHSDSIHMTTFPYGNLIAVWIALEDITADCGPLHYYAGSHKLPYLMNADYDNEGTTMKLGDKTYSDYEDAAEEVLQKTDYKKEVFLAKKGDILIWHANLLHGGEAINDDNSTRKSMVLHYYSTDSICYHEVTQRPTLK